MYQYMTKADSISFYFRMVYNVVNCYLFKPMSHVNINGSYHSLEFKKQTVIIAMLGANIHLQYWPLTLTSDRATRVFLEINMLHGA